MKIKKFDYQSDKDAYNCGVTAQENGVSIDINPYPNGSNEFRFWSRGWKDSYNEEYRKSMSEDSDDD